MILNSITELSMAAGTKNKGKSSSQFIFRGKSRTKFLSIKRVSIEAFLMMFVGTNMIAFILSQPVAVNYDTYFSEIWLELTQIISQFLQLVSDIAGTIIVFILFLLGLTLVLGGLLRTTKVIYLLRRKNIHKRDKSN